MPDRDEELKELLEGVLSSARERNASRYALASLFPKAEKALNTYVSWHHGSDTQRKADRRLSVPGVASTYFSIVPQKVEWGFSEIDNILRQSDPAVAFQLVEQRISMAPEATRLDLRKSFLETLSVAFGAERTLTLEWFRAIIAASPLYLSADEQMEPSFFMLDNAFLLRATIVNALMPWDPDRRASFVLQAIPSASDLSILCDFVRGALGDVHPDGAQRDQQNWFGDKGDEIRSLLLDRVRDLADSSEIWSQSRPSELLWFWWGCNCESEVKKFVDLSIKDDRWLRSMLKIVVSKAVSSLKGAYDKINKEWMKIVNLNLLTESARNILSSKNVSEVDRALAQRFLDAVVNSDWSGAPDTSANF